MSSTVNVLQVVGAMNMGGAEMFLMNVMRNIDTNKYKFTFLCYIDGVYDFEDEIKNMGGEIVRIKDNRMRNPTQFISDIEGVIKDRSIDIVHSHVDFSSGYAMRAAANMGLKNRITHSHNTSATRSRNIIKNIWLKFLGMQINRYATVRVACGKNAGEFMFGHRSFEVINNGVDVGQFRFNNQNRMKIRKQLHIGNDETVIIHAGRFELVKNHSKLIDIFFEYRRLDSTAKLILLGGGRLFDDIQQKVSALDLDGAVYLMGKRSNTTEYYSAADLFIMPSLYEGLPVTLVEAQMSGLEALASDTIDKSVNFGYVNFFPLSNTSEQWAGRIFDLDKSRKIPSDILIESYDIEKISKKIQEIYEIK